MKFWPMNGYTFVMVLRGDRKEEAFEIYHCLVVLEVGEHSLDKTSLAKFGAQLGFKGVLLGRRHQHYSPRLTEKFRCSDRQSREL